MMHNTRNQPVIRYGLGIVGVAVLLAVSQAVWSQAGPVTDDNIFSRLLFRPEVRYDYSDRPVFNSGDHNQWTFSVDALFTF